MPNSFAVVSPFEQPDPYLQNGNDSLLFHWQGLDDPTVTGVTYRFLQNELPLSGWQPLPVCKTAAVLEKERTKVLPEGEVILQLRALNNRNMTSDIASQTVYLSHSKPALTSMDPFVTIEDNLLTLDWEKVFSNLHDVTFSIFAGTAKGYGDVINHIVTKSTLLSVALNSHIPSELYVIIVAIQRNGAFAIYNGELSM